MPSFANLILAGIAVSAVATHLLSAGTRADRAFDAPMESVHSHKGDQLPLFQAAGPSITVATPSVRLVSGLQSGDGANTVFAIKNVVLVPAAPDQVAGKKPDPQPQDQSLQRRPSCAVVTGPFGKPNLGRLIGRCFT